MAHYAVGDIHGCFNDFINLKNQIEDSDPDAVFFLLGDIIDRGPNVIEMLLWAMDNITIDGKYQMVLGNHELEVIDWYQYHYIPWLEVSIPKYTMPRTYYDFSDVMEENDLLDKEHLDGTIKFFKERPLYINLKVEGALNYHARIAHAWYPDKNYLKTCDEEDYVWSRLHINKEFEDLEYKNAVLIHGHTPTQDQECVKYGAPAGLIWFKKRSINLDCGCCYKTFKGKLGAVCLENLTEYYSSNGKVTVITESGSQGRKKLIQDLINSQ